MEKKPKQNKKKKTGRPTIFNQELANKICHELSQGYSLRTVCLPEEMPAISSIFNWFRTHPDFLAQYARAKEESADAMAEEILDIADETISVIKGGAEKKSSALAQAQRLRVDTRKWIMSKMKPKRYADTLDLTSKGDKLPTPILNNIVNNVPSDNSNKKDTEADEED